MTTSTHPTPRLIVWAERCYRTLLLAYPKTFRRAYAEEMAQTFRESCRDTLHEKGRWGFVHLCGLIFADLVATVCTERIKACIEYLRHLFGLHLAFESAMLTAPLFLQIAQHTDIGLKRSINEDNLITVVPEDPQQLQHKGALFVVADGMGGHTQGDRASELAVTTVREAYYQAENVDNATALVQAMQAANLHIYNENRTKNHDVDDKMSMGTTCIAAVLQEQTLLVANVGDSRVYVVHQGQMRQVSQDHSLVARLVREGTITAEQARTHEKRNMIYRCFGEHAEVEVDLFEERVEEGDTLVLCTDGLSGLVDDTEILQIVETYKPEECVQQLIARANAAGGPDNITAVVVRVTPQK